MLSLQRNQHEDNVTFQFGLTKLLQIVSYFRNIMYGFVRHSFNIVSCEKYSFFTRSFTFFMLQHEQCYMKTYLNYYQYLFLCLPSIFYFTQDSLFKKRFYIFFRIYCIIYNGAKKYEINQLLYSLKTQSAGEKCPLNQFSVL